MFTVAAGILPAVEPGILPGGFSCGLRRQFLVQSCHSGRQDAARYGSQDGRRYVHAHGKHLRSPTEWAGRQAGRPRYLFRCWAGLSIPKSRRPGEDVAVVGLNFDLLAGRDVFLATDD